jgi:hypothetical protein
MLSSSRPHIASPTPPLATAVRKPASSVTARLVSQLAAPATASWAGASDTELLPLQTRNHPPSCVEDGISSVVLPYLTATHIEQSGIPHVAAFTYVS